MNEDLYKAMFNIIDSSKIITQADIYIDFNSLTTPQPEQDVEDIRQSAPMWFKSGNRLITKKDYEFFVTANRSSLFNGVLDAKCMNNWDYLTTFYRWLYNAGMNPVEEAFIKT